MTYKRIFFIGFILGLLATALIGKKVYRLSQRLDIQIRLPAKAEQVLSMKSRTIVQKFDKPIELNPGQVFGEEGFFTAELFRKGRFVADGVSGYAVQESPRYLDSAWIRSTKPLPPRYKISAVVGQIDYGLEKLEGIPQDSQYPEGPQNENGVYLLTITDVAPRGHHTNVWWHQHRKVVIDVDNNVWGHGMPYPVFMVYFDRDNELNSWNGKRWTKDWVKGMTYDPSAWYRVEIEKTWSYYILSVFSESGEILSQANVPLSKALHTNISYPDYFVLGDPHENYYTGSFKIKEIVVSF